MSLLQDNKAPKDLASNWIPTGDAFFLWGRKNSYQQKLDAPRPGARRAIVATPNATANNNKETSVSTKYASWYNESSRFRIDDRGRALVPSRTTRLSLGGQDIGQEGSAWAATATAWPGRAHGRRACEPRTASVPQSRSEV